jgi:hypothetical protein
LERAAGLASYGEHGAAATLAAAPFFEHRLPEVFERVRRTSFAPEQGTSPAVKTQ